MDAVEVESEARQSNLRVFIAEDSANVIESLGHLLALTGQGRVVAAASTEAEALDWAGSHASSWDLAIIDLILEQGSGFNVIRRLKQGHPAGRVVVFSGFVSDVIRRRCEDLGADLVLGKHENNRLADYVERLLRE